MGWLLVGDPGADPVRWSDDEGGGTAIRVWSGLAVTNHDLAAAESLSKAGWRGQTRSCASWSFLALSGAVSRRC